MIKRSNFHLLFLLMFSTSCSVWSDIVRYTFSGTITGIYIFSGGAPYNQNTDFVKEFIDPNLSFRYSTLLNTACTYSFDIDILQPGISIDGTGIQTTKTNEKITTVEGSTTYIDSTNYFNAKFTGTMKLPDLVTNDPSLNEYGFTYYGITETNGTITETYSNTSLWGGSLSHRIIVDNFYSPSISAWEKGQMYFLGSELSVAEDYSVLLISNNLSYQPNPLPPLPPPTPQPVPEPSVDVLLLSAILGLTVSFRRFKRKL